MRFNGRLQTEADGNGWLKSELSISGNKVELSAADELLGSWSVSQVRAERLSGDKFELHLGDDRAVFAADDALAFSYEALPKLTKKPLVEAAQGFRKLLGGGRKTPTVPETTTRVAPPPEELPLLLPEEPPPDEVPANVKRLRELIEVAKANRPEEAVSLPSPNRTDHEFTTYEPGTEPGPLWSMPETSFGRTEEPRPISLSIVESPVDLSVDPSPVDLAPSFNDESALTDELDRLADHVKTSRLSLAQTKAAIDLLRALRRLLS